MCKLVTTPWQEDNGYVPLAVCVCVEGGGVLRDSKTLETTSLTTLETALDHKLPARIIC